MCFTWYHTNCVGIKDLDGVEAWVCADCRALPKTVKFLKGQCEALLQTTEKMYKTVEMLTEKIDRKFDNLNDRLTTLSNQNKSSSQSCTSSLTDIHHDMKTFRTEIDKKSNSLLSKSQLIIDQIKSQPVPVNHAQPVQTNDKTKQTSQKTKQDNYIESKENSKQQQTTTATPIVIDADCDIEPQNTSSGSETHQNQNSQSNNSQANPTPPPKPQKRDLIFITGSEILQNIETRFLNTNVRVKSFRGATIDNLKSELAEMDLSRYQNIILHVGGHDIDANISQTLFRQKFQALLKSLDLVNCKVTVSGLLPRRGLSIRPFNDSLRDLCKSLNVEFISNHDSFVMASGELPFDFFQTDRINLKFSGTRKLVQNMNRSCAILPIQHNKGFNGQTKPKALRKSIDGFKTRFPRRMHRFYNMD